MANLGGHLRFKAPTRQFLSFGNIDTSQQVFDPRHRTTVHGQVAIAKTNQDRHAHRIARHFTAQPQVNAEAFGIMRNHRQRPQHRGMQAVIHAGNPGVVAIDGEDILSQVIGPYRDKIHAAGKIRQHKDHRRHFQHYAKTRARNSVANHLFDFTAGAIDQTARLIHLIKTGHHRQQNTQVAGGGIGTQHGAHLDEKYFRLIESNADAAPAEARVLFANRHIRQLFIGADIQRTQGHGLFIKHLQHALILGDLLLFRRETALQHKRDFGPVQADAVDKVAKLFFMFQAQASVQHDLHPLAAFQLGSVFQIVFRQPAEFVLFADQTLIFLQQRRFRVDQQFAAVAIHHQHVAVEQRRLDISPHNRRDPQRPHHNGGVGVGCAIADDDARQPVLRNFRQRRR